MNTSIIREGGLEPPNEKADPVKDTHPVTTTENGGGPHVSDENYFSSDGTESINGRTSPPIFSGFGTDPQLWALPDPADKEDERETIETASTNEDDDDYNPDGTPWGRSSFSSNPSEEGYNGNNINNLKEERQKAMMEAMNGQLKILVGRFFASEGILEKEEGGNCKKSWLDIITNLSWDAALLVKPDASEGKEMDPGSYVKIKCIASGTRDQSEVIKGLVFKKNAAHKHMPTSFKNPRLLLLKGVLGHSDVGLSFFDSMGQEKDYLEKLIGQMMEMCQPNVIMVEKTVSRDIQESLHKEGVTLILDMKMNRLERIARCTGSPIISFSDVFKEPKVRMCESFRIEKFVEEHNNNNIHSNSNGNSNNGVIDGGKKQKKTLMFLEGFPRPLGCTILLRGASSEELKKIKHVIQYTIFAAYHLILETSFFEDQRIFLNYKNAPREENTVPSKPLQSVPNGGALPSLNPLLPGYYCNNNGSFKENLDQKSGEFSFDFGFSNELNGKIVGPTENSESENGDGVNKGKMEDKEEMNRESILVLVSSQCITKQALCEPSHLTRIKYYGNFDVSLGRYLGDILLNQTHNCLKCGEPGEAHMYSYTHRNGNLTVLVKQLPIGQHLAGESEGKIWMWTRCIKCEGENGISKPTPRVVISASARSLSFGKFLELSFSSHSAARRLSICGHSLHRDCLRFFGLGSKVAMFRYSPVEIYTACKPPPILKFRNPNKRDWLKDDLKNVLARGAQLFSEIEIVLRHLKNKSTDLPSKELTRSVSFKDLPEPEELLIKEKSDFEVSVLEIIETSGKNEFTTAQELLSLNWLRQGLLLETYLWDRRLHHLFHSENAEQEPTTMQRSLSTPSLDNSSGEHTSDNAVSESYSDREDRKEFPVSSETPQLLEDSSERWVWSAFAELKSAYRNHIQTGDFEKFHLINSYKPEHLSSFREEPTQERDLMHLMRFVLGPDGHILSVSENEISSIISRALAISENQRNALLDVTLDSINNTNINTNNSNELVLEKSNSLISEGSGVASYWSSTNSFNSISSDASFLSFSSSSVSSSSDELSPQFDSSYLLSQELHPEIPVNGKLGLSGKYSVVCIYATKFHELRRKCCPSEIDYISSLSRCKKWDAQGGKSKAFFAKSMDDRFIIKQIKRTEFDSFMTFATDYFNHVFHSLDSGSQTCLAKILGIYQVRQVKNGKETKIDLMVMENLLFGRNVKRTYDLKGAIFSRYVADSEDQSEKVYLDQNFVNDMRVSPIYIGGKTKHLFQRAIWNDTSFLTSINVMDYSLLVGVDKTRNEFVFGIIDYLRQYTWDKQLETWVKSSLVPKNISPTVISPKEYKKRFRKFMSKNFLTVPDAWCNERCVGLCKFCSLGDNSHRQAKLADENAPHQHNDGAPTTS